ncbi:MAG TPA: hypothetical protein VGJ80_01065, partial [Gemmatimonadales bacterium]
MRGRPANLPRILGAALLAAACSDSVGPERSGPGAPRFDVAVSGGTTPSGSLGQSGNSLVTAFTTNPHHGDAVVVTFLWLGSSNIIMTVTDQLANGTPVNNTYRFVEYVQAGGLSMATYVATNVQNFPSPNPDQSTRLVVRATLSASVSDGGAMVSAYSGVSVSADAVGAHRSGSGTGSTTTVVGPGGIPVNAGALVYGVTMSNAQAGRLRPDSFTAVMTVGDSNMIAEGDYAPRASADSVNARWTWFFDADSRCTSTSPCTWLATVLALNKDQVQTQAAATQLAFTVQPTGTTAGSTISPAVRVAAQDGVGNTDATFAGPITVALGPNQNGGTLSGTTTVAAVNGVATFSNLSVDRAGSGYTLTATASNLTGATSAQFTITAAPPPPAPPPGGGIRFDTLNGTLENQSLNFIIKGFDPRNPHLGDAIIATIFWTGTSVNIIDSVTDHLTMPGFPRVGNKYNFVEYSNSGGLSMATYLATNVQGFPDAFRRPGDSILAVRANFSQAVTVRGIVISAWSGVAATFEAARGEHRDSSGTGSGEMDVGPGPISVNAGALAYAVTMSNAVAGRFFPAGFGPMLAQGNGTTLTTEADSALQSSGSVDPKWHWFFSNDPKCTASTPCTWLASVLALNPAGGTSSGNLRVTTSTTGSSLDPDGYTVTVDGSQSQAIATNNSTGITFSGLSAASHSVVLSGVAANCTVSGGNTQTVTVPSGGTATAAFSVSCTAATGDLHVTTSTT